MPQRPHTLVLVVSAVFAPAAMMNVDFVMKAGVVYKSP